MWSFEHFVVCAAPVRNAWAFWTDVVNWAIDADVERIEIDGPFAAGTRITQRMSIEGPRADIYATAYGPMLSFLATPQTSKSKPNQFLRF